MPPRHFPAPALSGQNSYCSTVYGSTSSCSSGSGARNHAVFVHTIMIDQAFCLVLTIRHTLDRRAHLLLGGIENLVYRRLNQMVKRHF